MAPTEADLAVERAIAAEQQKGTHDPRIEAMYRRDVLVIYAFVIALWIVLWGVYLLVANPMIHDNTLRYLMIGLGLFASIFNSVGMIQNTRRLKQESVRFYSQDLFWQDQKKLIKEQDRLDHDSMKRQATGGGSGA